jgi:hypothetical protein
MTVFAGQLSESCELSESCPAKTALEKYSFLVSLFATQQ